MSAAFTSGPWQSKHDFDKEGVCTIIANVDGVQHADGSTTYSYDFICTCEDEYGEYTEKAQANARLIRTAPELYEALEQLRKVVSAAGVSNLMNGVQLGQVSWAVKANDAMAYAETVLAKAARVAA